MLLRWVMTLCGGRQHDLRRRTERAGVGWRGTERAGVGWRGGLVLGLSATGLFNTRGDDQLVQLPDADLVRNASVGARVNVKGTVVVGDLPWIFRFGVAASSRHRARVNAAGCRETHVHLEQVGQVRRVLPGLGGRVVGGGGVGPSGADLGGSSVVRRDRRQVY